MKRLIPAIFLGGVVAFALILVLAKVTDVGQTTAPPLAKPPGDRLADPVESAAALGPSVDPKCDELEIEFANMLSDSASCQADADCVLANIDCVAAVNKSFLEELYELHEYRCRQSIPICAAPVNEWQAVCIQNRCRKVDRRGADVKVEIEQELMRELREQLERSINVETAVHFRNELEGSGLAEADIDRIVRELEAASVDCFIDSLMEHARLNGVPASSLVVEFEDEKGIVPVNLDFTDMLDQCLNAARLEAGIMAE